MNALEDIGKLCINFLFLQKSQLSCWNYVFTKCKMSIWKTTYYYLSAAGKCYYQWYGVILEGGYLYVM